MDEQLLRLLHAFGALADLSQEIADTNDSQEMVRSSLHVVLGALGIRRGAVAEYDRENHLLRLIAMRGIGGELLPDESFDAEDEKHLQFAAEDGCLMIREGVSSDAAQLITHHFAWFDRLRTELIVPLVVRSKTVGVMLLGGKASEASFTIADCEFIHAMARHIGVGIHYHSLLREIEQRAADNRRLYDDLQATYRDTVRAFAVAIDCKDQYTKGHSERVGHYCEIIAREMGWNTEQVEGMAVAGYLHDIGKLVIDREIINAPYKIDAKNSPEINLHVSAGYEILSAIHHPYADIPLMARYHHERPDGGGYPEGLIGEQIPIGARIITLADSFDAMTTDRPYKRRCTFEEVIEDFSRNAGKQFDHGVLIAFCRALLREVDGQAVDKQITKSFSEGYVNSERIRPLLNNLITQLEADAGAVRSTSVGLS